MGTIYVAEQLSTGKRRALKLMHPTLVTDAEQRERFVREAQVASHIASEHVVEVTAAGVDADSGAPYLAMELLDGETLAAYVKRRGFLPPSEVMVIFQQLCHAMMAAHAAGIIHRDLKPENVFLALSRRAGSAPFVVKVLDFGIAKLAAEAGSRSTAAMGSPLWMAPEQTERGTITAAADVWALGLMVYFALTGHVFWRAARDPQTTVAQVLREIVLEPIPAATIRANEMGLLDRLPPSFDRLFAQTVVRDPRARLPDAAAFWNALAALLDSLGATVAALPPSSAMRPLSRLPASSHQSPFGVSARERASAPTPQPAIPATAPAVASTLTQSSSPGPWIFGSAVVLAAAFAGTAYLVLSARNGTKDTITIQRTAAEAPPSVATVAPLRSAPDQVGATAPPAITVASATSTTTSVAVATAVPATSGTTKLRTSNTTDVSHGMDDSFGEGLTKRRTWKGAGHTIKVVPGSVQVSGNVPANVVRDALDFHPWMYLQCYEKHFSTATSLPHGTVTLAFTVFNQLPQKGSIDRSDFQNPAFSKCVLDTAMGNTANAAGPDGMATVIYPFIFTVVD